MDMTVSALSSAYLPAVPAQGAVRAPTDTNLRALPQDALARDGRSRTTPSPLEAERAREEAARRRDPVAEPARSPGFVFEFQDSRQVMKVHNAKGVLIYQVPSKGQLALIETEEAANRLDPRLRLTA
ncbi:MAG: hypothetical protein ACOZB0_03735 [Pseudomonadota bacterium]